MPHKLFQSLKTERKLQNTIYETRMTLIPKPNKVQNKIIDIMVERSQLQ